MTPNRLVDKAVRYLKRGLPIPVDLAAELQVSGYDVSTIERRYSRR